MSSVSSRLGPRPLPLHAFAAWRAHMLAVAALGAPGLLGPELSARIESLPPGAPRLALAAAVFAETARRWGGFWSGVGKYCAHPYRRPSQARPVFWRAGDVAAIDFAPEGAGPTVIAVPSLVNTSDVLDLLPGRSLMQALADAGFRPLLVDWGQPPEDARSWPIARYVDERLSPLLSAVRQRDGAPPILMGYCMGGLLAAALAARRPDDVGALALLATPWDFHAPSPEAGQVVAGMAAPFRQAAATSGAVPADLLQSLFFALDPTLAARKYRRFAEMDQASDEATLFVAMEDWVNGGPDLALPVAETVLGDWYGRNVTAKGQWRVGDHVVDNRSYPGPTLVAAPSRDRIVPQESARAYARGREGGNLGLLDVDGGHVGMIVGHDAEAQLWRPLFDWLHNASACGTP